MFTENDIEKGYVLACQTKINDDLQVVIPVESRIEDEQIMTIEAAKGHAKLQHKPIVTKIYLELPPPTLEDNISDMFGSFYYIVFCIYFFANNTL